LINKSPLVASGRSWFLGGFLLMVFCKFFGQDTIPDRFLLQNDKNLKLFDKYACQK